MFGDCIVSSPQYTTEILEVVVSTRRIYPFPHDIYSSEWAPSQITIVSNGCGGKVRIFLQLVGSQASVNVPESLVELIGEIGCIIKKINHFQNVGNNLRGGVVSLNNNQRASLDI